MPSPSLTTQDSSFQWTTASSSLQAAAASPTSSQWLASTSAARDDDVQFELPLTHNLRQEQPTFAVLSANNTAQAHTTKGFRTPSPAPRFNGFPSHVAMKPAPLPRSSSATSIDFETIRNQYITMLGQETPPSSAVPSTPEEALRNILETAGTTPPSLPARPASAADSLSPLSSLSPSASPEFRSLGDNFSADFDQYHGVQGFEHQPLFDDVEEYLTSPAERSLEDFDYGQATSPLDTPFSTFMPTPMMEAPADDFGEAPLIADDAAAFDLEGLLTMPDEEPHKLPSPPTTTTTTNNAVYTPTSPMLDAFPSPAPTTRRTRRSVPDATGTRKNITPEQLIPLDAPTQKRRYHTVSATSRKAVPNGFLPGTRKRKRDADDDDDYAEGDDDEFGAGLTPAQKATIEYKRRQNTLAARKSRKRKLEHTQALETRLEEMEIELTRWRERAEMGREMLKQKGVTIEW